MNTSQRNMPGNIPPGIFEKIIQPGLARRNQMGATSMPGNMTEQIMKRLDVIEKRLAALSGSKDLQNPRVEDQNNEMEVQEKKIRNLPGFLKEEFNRDFDEKPAEAIVSLLADIYERKPDMMAGEGSPMKDMMGLFSSLSQQVRRDRLFDKHDDAREMVEDIEKLFDEIPEIKKRADAYEIAYKLVKSSLTGNIEVKRQEKKTKKRGRTDIDENTKSKNKENAFVENSKISKSNREKSELTPAQREICEKMGISEKSFRRYMKK